MTIVESGVRLYSASCGHQFDCVASPSHTCRTAGRWLLAVDGSILNTTYVCSITNAVLLCQLSELPANQLTINDDKRHRRSQDFPRAGALSFFLISWWFLKKIVVLIIHSNREVCVWQRVFGCGGSNGVITTIIGSRYYYYDLLFTALHHYTASSILLSM